MKSYHVSNYDSVNCISSLWCVNLSFIAEKSAILYFYYAIITYIMTILKVAIVYKHIAKYKIGKMN